MASRLEISARSFLQRLTFGKKLKGQVNQALNLQEAQQPDLLTGSFQSIPHQGLHYHRALYPEI